MTSSDSEWPQWLSISTVVVYYTLYPIYLLLAAVWYIVVLLSRPFVSIGRTIGNISLIPWRIFARFEALWYYLASAVLLGLLLGGLLHLTLRAFVVVFRLDRKYPAQEPRPIPARGHDAVSYRKAREAKKRKELEKQQNLATQARLIASQPLLQEAVREARKLPLSTATTSPLSPVSPGNPEQPWRLGLLQETILEHSDEDDDDSVF